MWDPATDVSEEEWNQIHTTLPSFSDWTAPPGSGPTGRPLPSPAAPNHQSGSAQPGLSIEACGSTPGVHVWRVNRGRTDYLADFDR